MAPKQYISRWFEGSDDLEFCKSLSLLMKNIVCYMHF